MDPRAHHPRNGPGLYLLVVGSILLYLSETFSITISLVIIAVIKVIKY